MTNKTEMMSVPRELLERCFSNKADGYVTVLTAFDELKDLIAAPAEDVRAVVDEPVAYMRQDDSTYNNLVQCAFTCPGAFGVYRSLPRPFVMPERKTINQGQEDNRAVYGYNACVDDFIRLNPQVKQ